MLSPPGIFKSSLGNSGNFGNFGWLNADGRMLTAFFAGNFFPRSIVQSSSARDSYDAAELLGEAELARRAECIRSIDSPIAQTDPKRFGAERQA